MIEWQEGEKDKGEQGESCEDDNETISNIQRKHNTSIFPSNTIKTIATYVDNLF